MSGASSRGGGSWLVRRSSYGASRLRVRMLVFALTFPLVVNAAAAAQSDARPPNPGLSSPASETQGAFSFALVGTGTEDLVESEMLANLLRAVDASSAQFVVHFDAGNGKSASCSDAALASRKAALDASAKPVVPVAGAGDWSACAALRTDPIERLNRLRELTFGANESLGQTRLQWVRQSAMPRYHRYNENLRWQSGPILFIAIDIPDNNNNFRFGAGRNGEFEERLVANRIWLERAFRIAAERRMLGIVIAIDADPRFETPLHPPDARTRERDGYYEFKIALRDMSLRFSGQVLLVQGRAPRAAALPLSDHPLRDPAGRALFNFTRIAAFDANDTNRWFRLDVDPARAPLFRIVDERVFDDPTGELYGPGRVK